MTPRIARVERQTKETKISVEVNLDGTGVSKIQTPLPFLSHMLDQIARHGSIDLTVLAEGDVEIDGHHTTEDIGIVLGKAVLDALGDRHGIRRYGSATLPMDEALVTAALDLSGRAFFVWRVPLPKAKIGTWDVELAEVFFEAFARTAQANLHVVLHEGQNLHHIVEICFKAFCAGAARRDRARPACAGGTVDQGDVGVTSVVVVDVGLGNLRSVEKALELAGREYGITPVRSSDPDQVRRADAIVVPGQSNFDGFLKALGPELFQVLLERLRAGTPYLGICLGMQILFESSEEAPGFQGLGWFKGCGQKAARGTRHQNPTHGLERARAACWRSPRAGRRRGGR